MRSQACFACSFTKFRVRGKYFQAHAGKSDTSTVFCPTEAYPVPPTLLPSAGCGLPCIWLPAGRRCRSRRRVPGCSRAGAASLAAAPPPGTPPPWCRPHRTSGRTSCWKRCGGLHAESWRTVFGSLRLHVQEPETSDAIHCARKMTCTYLSFLCFLLLGRMWITMG